jgi:hypothetical protein
MTVTTLTVYLPAAGAPDTSGISAGSGVVGPELPDATGRIQIDFEGNLYDAVNMRRYEERVYHAASRQLWNNGRGYPTVARLWVEPTSVIAVGTIDVDTTSWVYSVEITEQELVDAWVEKYATRSGRR